ncbi:branched-chain amino acid ABC transporter permease [Oscillibacter sp.]|uniref:branched-chain amino acid ABC transporter permease n=1 Tax=Oscillibacter sp. TaxID=1945593 RepID=UPI003390A838
MIKKNDHKKAWIALMIAVAVLVLVGALDNLPHVPSMLLTVLQKGAIYALVAVSMNLLNGFTGLFSLGQAGFMLLGAYTYAVLTVPVERQASVYQRYEEGGLGFSVTQSLGNSMGQFGLLLGVVICLILAGCVAGFFAWLIGLPVLKLKSDYLAIATLGFAEIIRAVVQYEKLGPVTNGSNLLYGFTGFTDFHLGSLKLTTVMPFLFSGLCIFVVVLLINSTYGRAFKAIRDDEVAAEAMGINLAKHKRMSFIISSFFAGISGALLAMFQASVQAVAFKAAMTYEILLIVVIGGIGSITGSAIASFLFVGCSEWGLRFLDNETTLKNFDAKVKFAVIFGVLIAAVVAFGLLSMKRKGEKLITRAAQGRPAVRWGAVLGLAVAAIALLWDVWFVISPRLKLPLLRSGFRMVVFSVVIMIMVLFFREGIMGDKELWDLGKKKRSAKAKAGVGNE